MEAHEKSANERSNGAKRDDEKHESERSDATQSPSPMYEYIRLRIELNRLPAIENFEAFYQQWRHLIRQINDTLVMCDGLLDAIILYMSKAGLELEDVAARLGFRKGDWDLKDKLHKWLLSRGEETTELDTAGRSPVYSIYTFADAGEFSGNRA
jgi:hypothetical protein